MSRDSRFGSNAFWLVIFALVCLFPITTEAQNFTTFTEWPVPTAASGPQNVVTASKSTAYFTEQTASKLGFIDMNKSVITEWTLPAGATPHGLNLQGQTVVFGEENGHVAELDPNTNMLTEWAVPTICCSGPIVLHVAAQGKSVFFSDFGQSLIGMLNLSTNQITLWQPGAPLTSQNGVIVVGSSSKLQVWAAGNGRISMLNPTTNSFTAWNVPGNFVPQHIDIAPDGSIIFEDSFQNLIGELNPASNIVREWNVPMASSTPWTVASLSPGVVAFVEQTGNNVGTLNTSATPDVNETVTPTVTTVTPTVNLVSPVSTPLAHTITPVTPTVTGASRVVTGGFSEYIIPTSSSLPTGLSTNSVGALIFTESSGNKVGRLQ